MRKYLFFGLVISASAVLLISCKSVGNKLEYINQEIKLPKIERIIYFNPEIYPEIEEIKEVSYTSFFSAVSDKLKTLGDYKILRVETPVKFDAVDKDIIIETCINNNAEIAVVPKIKYFKVGLGKYVFSSQVIVSLKLYNANGDFVAETSYDTYKANARMLGATENSIKIGTEGAIQKMSKELRTRDMLYRKRIL